MRCTYCTLSLHVFPGAGCVHDYESRSAPRRGGALGSPRPHAIILRNVDTCCGGCGVNASTTRFVDIALVSTLLLRRAVLTIFGRRGGVAVLRLHIYSNERTGEFTYQNTSSISYSLFVCCAGSAASFFACGGCERYEFSRSRIDLHPARLSESTSVEEHPRLCVRTRG